MRVLVVGGYGLIGSYVVARLHAGGWDVVGLGRDTEAAARRLPYVNWVRANLGRMRTPADWAPLLAGVDAVVNCAGALQDSPRDNLRAIHVDAATALYEACAPGHVRRVVHISAVGVDAASSTMFGRTKQAAEAALKGMDLDWIILRPGLVIAPAAYGGTALLRGLAGFPLFIPALAPRQIVQAVSVQDVAEAVARALAPDAPARLSLDVASAEKTTLGEILTALRAWLGFRPAPLASVPAALAGAVALASDAIGFMGWRSPMRSTSIAQLKAGVIADDSAIETVLGFKPKSLDQMLAGWPSGVQERWFARLYFLKPAALIVLIGFWFASGAIGLTAGFNEAVAALTAVAAPLLAAKTVVIGGAVLDMALALLACVRATAPTALIGVVATSAAYLVGATILRPDLWAEPFGPLVKVVPGAILALVVLAMMDER
jgi:uncharacterized protein YbjT (DUF2867 family)